MAESLKQKLGFVVAAMMMVAALAVLNLGAPADAQSKRCKPDGGGNRSASPSPTESEEPFPPELPPVVPEETESPSPTETTGSQARKCESGITLNYKGPSRKKPARRQFSGKVSSQEDDCKVGRKVLLKKKKKKGRDRTIEATVTKRKGSFKMPVQRANGKYYAKTPKDRVASDGGRVNCGAAKSKVVKV